MKKHLCLKNSRNERKIIYIMALDLERKKASILDDSKFFSRSKNTKRKKKKKVIYQTIRFDLENNSPYRKILTNTRHLIKLS